jgi:hypothetical protein
MTAGDSPWQAEGAISFATFVTRLLRTDQALLDEPGFPFDSTDDLLRIMFWFSAKRGAAVGTDQVFAQPLPPNLGLATRARIFHERMHYAALVSYPVLQLHALHGLEQLRVELGEREGYPAFVAGETSSHVTADASSIRSASDATKTLLLGEAEPWSSEVTSVAGADGAGIVGAGMTPPDGHRMPGAAGVLRFRESDVIIPFSGENLLESAAFISQCLFQGQEIPRVDEVTTAHEARYLGCWEIWRRMHGSRYGSTSDLALSFLAGVDLALGAHVLAQEDDHMREALEDPWRSAQIRYPHARFGAILIATADASQLATTPDPISSIQALHRFQHEICAQLGWGDPDRGYALMAAFLTERLLEASLWSFEDKIDIDVPALACAINTPLGELADDLTVLMPVWRMIGEGFRSTPQQGSANVVFGSRMLAKMIAASYFRSSNPPMTAAPHLDPRQLHERFRLPCIRIGGQYYMDDEALADFQRSIHGLEINVLHEDPFRLPAIDLLTDCIGLASLDGLRYGDNECGLIDRVTREPTCFYVAAGAGCPRCGLSPEEADARRAHGIDDWCHWTHAAIRTGVAPMDVRTRWSDRWRASM